MAPIRDLLYDLALSGGTSVGFLVGQVEVAGPFLPRPALAQITERVRAAFLRPNAEGRLVVHLRNEAASATGYEVTYAYLEDDAGTRDARNEVREALGLPAPRADW